MGGVNQRLGIPPFPLFPPLSSPLPSSPISRSPLEVGPLNTVRRPGKRCKPKLNLVHFSLKI